MARICLISCVRAKRDCLSPAADLYVSPWFAKAKQYARKYCEQWYILSTEHGILRPEDIVKPYEKTLNRMPKSAREIWARSVFADLKQRIEPTDQITILAGMRYREFLMPLLRAKCSNITIPMEHLTIGCQLQWLDQQVAN
jgi:hypothetical protein